MSIPVFSGQPVNPGRSLDADRLYQQYTEYYNDINTKIHALDSLPYGQRTQASVQEARASLITLQQQLNSVYTREYGNSNATLATFQEDCSSIESQVTSIFNEATGNGGSSIHEAIEKKYVNAQSIVISLKQKIAQDQEYMNTLTSQQTALSTTIDQLQQEIDSLPASDPRKATAQKDLDAAKKTLKSLQSLVTTAQSQLTAVQEELATFTQPQGAFDQLKALASLQNPTQANLEEANEDVKNLTEILDRENTTLQANLTAANNQLVSVNSAIKTVQTALLPLPEIHDQIQEDYLKAQAGATNLSQQLSQSQDSIDQLLEQKSELEAMLANLDEKIDALDPTDPRRAKVQSAFESANEALEQLNAQIKNAQSQYSTLQGMLAEIVGPTGSLSKLQELSAKSNPTQSDLDQAGIELQKIQAGQNYAQNILQATLSAARDKVKSVNSLIHDVQIGLQPSGSIEHATWYLDWTSWDYPVPEHVNTVNIFVGNMHLDSNGEPVIDGFGNMNSEKMNAFIQECHAKGIVVKLSIGGGGGSYDHCWDILTQQNVGKVAQALVDFCHLHGADGIDFDIENTDQVEKQVLAGTLIKKFKTIDPNLQATVCTNAGTVWQTSLKNVMDAASIIDPVTGEVTCLLDRVYVMSYYRDLATEQKDILSWADWLAKNYNFDKSQLTVGLDDKDAHAYDIKAFAAWAAENGFSTGYWEWDPARAGESNQSTGDIEDAYNGAFLLPFMAV